MKKLKSIFNQKLLIRVATLVWITLATMFLSDNLVVSRSANFVFDDIQNVPYNKVGVLLGTSKYTSRNYRNQYFDNRIKAAVSLFHAGKIDFILISGDNQYAYYNEPQMMLDDLLAQGIPREKIFLDYAGFRTLDSVIRAKKIFGLKRFTVISQRFHNERAIYIAQNNNMEVVGYNAQDVNKKYGFKTNVREKFARVKVVLDILTGKEPKFLGEKILIH
jgi:SanA protein